MKDRTEIHNKRYKFIKESVSSKKEYYAYCTMHKWWAAEKPITLEIIKNDYKKPSPYKYDYVKLVWTEQFSNTIWFYCFWNNDFEDIILEDWTFIISHWFMVLFPEKEISKCYIKYIEDMKDKQKKLRMEQLEEIVKEEKNIDDMNYQEIKYYIDDLLEYIKLKKD